MSSWRILLLAPVAVLICSCAPINESRRAYVYGPAYNDQGYLYPRPSYAEYGYPSYFAPEFRNREKHPYLASEGFGSPSAGCVPFCQR